MKWKVHVKEIMNTDVKTVRPGDSVDKAVQIMKENNIGSVIVADTKVLGILTATDIAHKYVGSKKKKQVRSIMTKDVVKIAPSMTMEEAAKIMASKRIEKLPVVDRKKLVGILTASDILSVEPTLFELLLENMKATKTHPDTKDD